MLLAKHYSRLLSCKSIKHSSCCASENLKHRLNSQYVVQDAGSLISDLSSEMSPKPPLGSRLVSLCAAEKGIVDIIRAKVVFIWLRIRCRVEVSVSYDGTVSMQAFISKLPERNRQLCIVVSPDRC